MVSRSYSVQHTNSSCTPAWPDPAAGGRRAEPGSVAAPADGPELALRDPGQNEQAHDAADEREAGRHAERRDVPLPEQRVPRARAQSDDHLHTKAVAAVSTLRSTTDRPCHEI